MEFHIPVFVSFGYIVTIWNEHDGFSVDNKKENLPRTKKYINVTNYVWDSHKSGRNDVTKKGPGYYVLLKMATLNLNIGEEFHVYLMHFRSWNNAR